MLQPGAQVLIIGGTRYIGRHTCLAALAAGAEVTLFNRGRTPADWLQAYPTIRRVLGDRNDPAALAQAFDRRYDVVYDLVVSRAEHVRPLLHQHAARIGQLVVCSTTSVYAPALYQPIDEAHPRGPHPAWSKQGKNAAEDLLAAAALPTTVLRPQWVFGAHDYQGLAAFYLQRLAAGLPIWLAHPGVAQLNWTYAPDLAQAFVLVTGHPEAVGRAFNVVCSETLTGMDFIRLCGQLLGVVPDIRRYRPADLPPELAGQRSGTLRDLPLACTAEAISTLCGFRPTPMPAALLHTADWLRATGALAAPELTAVERHLQARA